VGWKQRGPLPQYGSEMKEKEWELVNFHKEEMKEEKDCHCYFILYNDVQKIHLIHPL